MLPPGGVGVTVAPLQRPPPDDALLPPGVAGRPSRLGELLPVEDMSPEQKAANLQRIAEIEAQLVAFKAELVVRLAADRPASDDRRSGRPGAASGEWAAELLGASLSEFLPGRAGADPELLMCGCHRAVGAVQHPATAAAPYGGGARRR